MSEKNSILVIGKPNSGKSGFFGQLYARLNQQSKDTYAQLLKTPDNIEAIDNILDRYAEGKALEHTPVNEFENLEIDIQIGSKSITLRYPDYGGEQVNAIMNTRRLDSRWHNHIQVSDSWFLFIRVGSLNPSYDPINKFAEIVKNDEQGTAVVEDLPSDQAFYIELLQILLYHKGIGHIQKNTVPHLTVVISCWDEIEGLEDKEKPAQLLKKHLPLLNIFLEQNWDSSAYKIIGLSSQGKTLDKDESDEEYINEEEGYLILGDGSSTEDLTRILNTTE